MGSIFVGNRGWRKFTFSTGSRPAGYLVDFWAFNDYSEQFNEFTDIAIDDIALENCAVIIPGPDETFDCLDGTFINPKKQCNFIRDCSNGLDEVNCGDCDFEKSSCAWFDDSPGELIWDRGQAGSASTTGPSVDHTLGNPNGWYIFVNSRSGDYFFDYADLVVDKDLGPSSSSCEIEFYYHMLGQTDELVLYLAIDYQTTTSYTYLFDYIGDAGDKWNKAVIPIGRISNTFRLIMSAERFFSQPNNDIAVDDIRLYNCEFPPERPEGCQANYFTCDRKACVFNSHVCDLTDDCGDNSDENNCAGFTRCDFESKTLCAWKTEISDIYAGQWTLGTQFNFYRPSRDHTIGLKSGTYVLLRGINNQKALLVTPIFKPTNLCEFRIFVYMFAETNVGEFNVYSRTRVNGGDRLIYSIKNSVGPFWQKHIIQINETDSFQIIVEGLKRSDPTQIIAIDDTSFDKGCVPDNSNVTLPTQLTTTTTTTTQNPCGIGGFTCPTNGICVNASQVYNFIDDCPDGAEEKNCGTCDFETSTCGWYDDGRFVLKKILIVITRVINFNFKGM